MIDFNEIKEEATRCLGCKASPCSKACPMHTNIPEFIQKIKEDNLKEAYNILINNNLFSHVCSIICPQENECQGACIKGINGKPTQIGKLEKAVNEWAVENNVKPDIKIPENNNSKKVAIIGSGPAGLSCAYELIKYGIKPVVYEKENVLGGLLMYGIPDFRLDKKIVNNTINGLKELGVKFKTGIELGKDITINGLKKEYDYIFIGVGAEISSEYKLSDEKLDGVYNSDEFLKTYNSGNKTYDLGNVVVIGGGNVAMDSARAAVRMGAKKVSILYRRDRAHMPAREVELEDCLKEGISFKELTRVVSANSENGKLESLHCVNTKIVDDKAIDSEGEFDYDADTVIFAIGLKPNSKMLESQGLRLTENGTLYVDENNETSIENVYSGGDCTYNKSVVCSALEAGKKSAEAIARK